MRKKLKKDGELLSGVFLLVADEELGKSEDYELIIWACMHEDYGELGKRTQAQNYWTPSNLNSTAAGVSALNQQSYGVKPTSGYPTCES